MTKLGLCLVLALLLLGCSTPAVQPSHGGSEPPAAGTPTPTQTPTEPPDQPEQRSEPIPRVPELVIRTARLSDLSQQTDLYHFAAGQGRIRLSPDAHYLLYSACDPCDERLLYRPMILDLQTMQAKPASETVQGWRMPRLVPWSNDGFWVEPLVQVSVDGRVETHPELRRALVPEGWTLLAAEVSSDEHWVALAIKPERPSAETVADLVIADRHGDAVKRIERGIPAIEYSRGTDLSISWAPDSSQFVACGMDCWLIDPTHPAKEAWHQFPGRKPPNAVRFSPEGKHVLIPGVGVVRLDGTVVLPLAGDAVWNADGTGVLTSGRVVEYRLDGSRTERGDIGDQVILGWLPDGQIVLLGMQ